MTSLPTETAPLDAKGLAYGIGAYGFWGAFPLYFILVAAASPQEVIGHRIFWTLVFSLLGVLAVGQWQGFKTALANRKLTTSLAIAGVLVASNWSVYVWAVLNEHLIDASLGYFVNPFFTVLLAVIFLKERLRPLQIVALTVGSSAVIVIAVGYGEIPWVALVLAITFAFYGLLKNRVGADVTPLVGLTLETLPMAPFALAFIAWLQVTNSGTLFSVTPIHTIALLLAGVVTAVPLLLFAGAARRIPLSTVGLLQYICPVCQFLLGWLVFKEQMPTARWIGLILIWIALMILTFDTIRTSRKSTN